MNIQKIIEKLKNPVVVFTDLKGVKANDISKLRKKGANFTVVKKTFLNLAFKEMGMDPQEMNGEIAISTGEEAIRFASKLKVLGGIIENDFKTAEEIKALAPVEEEQAEEVVEIDEYDVELTAVGTSKINVIKAIREITGLGLREAKEITDNAPKVIKEKISKSQAEGLKLKLEEAGATITLKP